MNDIVIVASLGLGICASVAVMYKLIMKDSCYGVSHRVVKYDNDLVLYALRAVHDYHNANHCATKMINTAREKLFQRYQEYKMMKRDNEFGIPKRYMEVRMNQIYETLQFMNPV